MIQELNREQKMVSMHLLLTAAALIAVAASRELLVREGQFLWTLNCGVDEGDASYDYESEWTSKYMLNISSVDIDWSDSNAYSCLNDRTYQVQELLQRRCPGRKTCSWSTSDFNSHGFCPMVVRYECEERPVVNITMSVLHTESDDARYSKVVSSGSIWTDELNTLECPAVSLSSNYELHIMSVNAPRSWANSTCSQSTRANFLEFLSERCNGWSSCRWFADGFGENDCSMEIGYDCFKSAETSTTSQYTTQDYKYYTDAPKISAQKYVGCDWETSWSFSCDANRSEVVNIVSVDPAQCLSLPCSSEKTASLKTDLYWKCYQQSSCSLDLREMSSWGFRCGASVSFDCERRTIPAGEVWMASGAAKNDHPWSYGFLMMAALLSATQAIMF